MKTRKHQKIREIALSECRPARQFLNVLKTLIDNSSQTLDQHRTYYRDAKSKFHILKTVFDETNSTLTDAESQRLPYIRSNRLNAEYVAAQDAMLAATVALREVETDAIKRQWEGQLLKLTTTLHLQQMKQFNTQRNKDIDTHKRLRLAEKQLDLLQQEADRTDKCYVSSARIQLSLEKVTAQKKVVELLESKLNEPIVTPQLTALQEELDHLNLQIKNYADNRDAMLSAAKDKLKAARQQFKMLEADVEHESKHYYTELDPGNIRAVIRLYSALVDYKTAFDKVSDTKFSHDEEIVSYQQRMTATKLRLDKWMEQLWSSGFGQANALDVYQQLAKMDAEQRALILKPASAVTTPALTSLGDVKLSTQGLFKRSLTAADKRRLMFSVSGMKVPGEETHKAAIKL
jgi:hypothetical protein